MCNPPGHPGHQVSSINYENLCKGYTGWLQSLKLFNEDNVHIITQYQNYDRYNQ